MHHEERMEECMAMRRCPPDQASNVKLNEIDCTICVTGAGVGDRNEALGTGVGVGVGVLFGDAVGAEVVLPISL